MRTWHAHGHIELELPGDDNKAELNEKTKIQKNPGMGFLIYVVCCLRQCVCVLEVAKKVSIGQDV